VLVDRWDRKKTMVTCDIGRALVVSTLPFVDTLAGLFLASFLLEILTLLWSPAKDASVPNLVPPDKLAAANSLSLAAAYGTFPVGSLLFASLAGLAAWLGKFDALSGLDVNRESVALWFDGATFAASAILIATLSLHRPTRAGGGQVEWSRTIRDLVDGLRFIGSTPVVRSVMLGVGAGLMGSGAVVPLGPIYVNQVLGAGSAGFGLLMTGLGTGAAIGVLSLSATSRRVRSHAVFVGAVVATGVALILATSVATLTSAVLLTGVFGLFAGSAYVAGFTVIQEEVADELRGRTFATLYTVIRLCLLLALALAPWLAGALDSLSDRFFDGTIDVGFRVAIPGVRLAFWLGGLVTVAAGLVAGRDMRRVRRTAP
jgi:dTMP kinase